MFNGRVYLTNAFLACFDIVVVAAAGMAVLHIVPPAPMLFFWAAFSFHFGMYRSRRLDSPLADTIIVFKVAVACWIMSQLAAAGVPRLGLAHFAAARFAGTGFLTLTVARLMLRAMLREIRRRGYNVKRLVLIASDEAMDRLEGTVRHNSHYGYRVVARLTPTGGAGGPGGNFENNTFRDRFHELISATRVDDVILALPAGVNALSALLLEECENQGIHVRIVPDLFPLVQADAQIYNFDGIPLIDARLYPSERLGYVVIKRLFDLGVSILALTVLSPLLAVISILILKTSRGPVFFRQERVGMNGKRFLIVKFRTMNVDRSLDPATHWTVHGDRHVTPLGRWLRRTNLDELPQFLNVLKGEMSVVGPRPERPFFIERFRREIPEYMVRHYVKSGITGWAQVNGWRGDTNIPQRVAHDLYYIRHWTLSFDIRILGLTLARAFFPGTGSLNREETGGSQH